MNNTIFPSWDPAWLDVSRFIKAEFPEGLKIDVDAPPKLLHRSKQSPTVSLFFHLPKSKAAYLEKLATPTDGSWVSTYDAFSTFIRHALTRLRAQAFKPDTSSRPIWQETVDIRKP